MNKFIEMQTFAAVVNAGSFVNAADALDMSKAAVSRHINELESRLGVRLLQRTTRRLSLTQEGEVFYARCEELLAQLDEAESEMSLRTAEPSGLLKINAPVSFGISHLSGLWAEFTARHPKVSLDIQLSDRVIDLVEEGYDLAIRIARLESSSLVGRKISSTRMVLCASPKYLKKYGTPKHPSELAKHAVLAYTYFALKDEWVFDGPEGKVTVKTIPFLHTNNGDTCKVGALGHHGIILQPTFMLGDELRSGALVEILPAYKSVELGIYTMVPTRRFLSPKVRLMIEFLADLFKKTPWPK